MLRVNVGFRVVGCMPRVSSVRYVGGYRACCRRGLITNRVGCSSYVLILTKPWALNP